ncbi:MAG: hypothetical protein ABWX92_13000 [Mycetocola sp.]
MGIFLEPSDLPIGTGSNVGLTPDQMIEDAEALALLAAPCLNDGTVALTAAQVAAVRAVLRGALMRWSDAGSGARQSVSTGPFAETIDTTVTRRGMFWPSEITHLQGICSDGQKGKAFSVDTVGSVGGPMHVDICSVAWGAPCSCGASLTLGYPLWETGGY